jgi:hypothetical protein
MSLKIMSEAWDYCPPGFTTHQKMVLLRLAERATTESRMAWESVATIAKQTLMSERSVQNALAALEGLGVLTGDYDPDEIPKAAYRYKSAVRKITERDCWGWEPADPEVVTVSFAAPPDGVVEPNTENPDEVVTVSFAAPNTSRSNSSSSREKKKRPYYVGKSDDFDLERSGSLSGRARAQAVAEAEAESDPWQAIQEDDLPEPVTAGSGWAQLERVRREGRSSGRGRTRLTPAQNLARFFKVEAKARDIVGPGQVNQAALAKNFRNWNESDGWSYEKTHAMIEMYWSDGWAPQRRTHRPAFLDFLNQRTNLANRIIEQGAVTNRAAAHRLPERRSLLGFVPEGDSEPEEGTT